MSSRVSLLALGALLAVGAPSLVHAQGVEYPAPKSLYERLGGKSAIAAVVDEFVARVAADSRINNFFAATAADPARLAAFTARTWSNAASISSGTWTAGPLRAASANSPSTWPAW